jgi:hypothetical protein
MITKNLSALKSIKKYCRYECCANDTISWKNCTRIECPLFPYRLGVGNRKINLKRGSIPTNFIKKSPLSEEIKDEM